MYTFTIVLFGIVSFVVGYVTSSFRTMMIMYGGGVVLALVIAVPDWPYFNQSPQRWLPVDRAHPKRNISGKGKVEGGGGEGVKGNRRKR